MHKFGSIGSILQLHNTKKRTPLCPNIQLKTYTRVQCTVLTTFEPNVRYIAGTSFFTQILKSYLFQPAILYSIHVCRKGWHYSCPVIPCIICLNDNSYNIKLWTISTDFIYIRFLFSHRFPECAANMHFVGYILLSLKIPMFYWTCLQTWEHLHYAKWCRR